MSGSFYGGRNDRRFATSGERMVFDHKRRLEVSALAVWGIKKARFNSIDYGVIVGSTYANAHT